MENNQPHNSGAHSMLYNTEVKGLPLSSLIFICTSPVYFAVKKFPSETLMSLSIYNRKPGTIS